jgi:hypothetical protein
MTPPRLIACVGTTRVTDRIEDDLACSPRDRRLIIVISDKDCDKLRGLRGPDVAYVDMSASWYQRAFCKLREIPEISIDEARELLKAPQERIPNR